MLTEIIINISLMAIWSALAITAGITALAGMTGKPLYAPVQAISHILFGERSYQSKELNLTFMLVGFGLNALAMVGWSGIAEIAIRAFGLPPRNLVVALIVAVAVTAAAYVVDFYVVPKRLTPGFEHVLSKPALIIVYVILAFSLLFGAMGRVA